MELSWQLGDEGPHHAVLASLSSQCDVDEEVEVGYGRGGCGLGAAEGGGGAGGADSPCIPLKFKF